MTNKEKMGVIRCLITMDKSMHEDDREELLCFVNSLETKPTLDDLIATVRPGVSFAEEYTIQPAQDYLDSTYRYESD